MATVAEALTQAQKSYEAGDLAGAEQICRHILGVQSQHAGAWFLMGAACESQGKAADAQSHYQHVLELLPNCAEAHAALGNTFARQRQLADAQACYQQALALRPTDAQTHYNLGVVLAQQGDLEAAVTHYQATLKLLPTDVEAHNNLGNALRQLGRPEDALVSHQQALQMRPDSAAVINNVAATLIDLGRLEEAVALCHKALRISPNLPEPHTNLGQLRRQQGRLDEALANYEQALKLKPDHAEARWNRALVWLLRGEWDRGWAEYEWRWSQPGRVRPASSQPRWDGSPLRDRTLLISAEQGLGDTIQFIRYAALAKERGGTVIVECPVPLLRLLAGVRGIDQLAPANAPMPAHDVHAPLLSLPGILRTTVATIPAEVPYLRPDAHLIDHWHKFLEPLWGFKIGIAWQGNPHFCDDRRRSIPLAQFAPLGQVDGVRLISLQKGVGTEQLAAVADKMQVFDLGRNLDEAQGPFMDTAAIMKNLDLVICSDSAVAHLAGALGVPVWLALPSVPDWRWLLDRADSPWYPSMRLFRQTRAGNWGDVFKQITEELRSLLSRKDG